MCLVSENSSKAFETVRISFRRAVPGNFRRAFRKSVRIVPKSSSAFSGKLFEYFSEVFRISFRICSRFGKPVSKPVRRLSEMSSEASKDFSKYISELHNNRALYVLRNYEWRTQIDRNLLWRFIGAIARSRFESVFDKLRKSFVGSFPR